MHYLSFKGYSSLDFGLLINKKHSYKAPARDVTFISVPGRCGDLITDNGRYKNVTIPYSLTLLKNPNTNNNFAELTHTIKEWLLSESGYFPLCDSYDPTYYRLASYSDETDIEEELKNIGTVTLNFNCKPFKYSFEGANSIIFTSPGSISNPEYLPSSPYIKVVGSGDITLSFNNDSFLFSGVDEFIEIDSEIMNAFKGGESQNHKMKTPKFPVLKPGENNISWVGNVTQLQIVPRWCAL